MNAYAGIGSRSTPQEIGYWMNEIASYMARNGWLLRSGGADGADSEFERGCGDGPKEIYLPWPEFRGHQSPLWYLSEHTAFGALAVAERVWNNRYQNGEVQVPWNVLKERTKKFMTRNCYQILGRQLNDPSKLVICWTADGGPSGGTGQALWLAKMVSESSKISHKITVINLQNSTHRETMRNAMRTDMNPIHLWSGGDNGES